MTRRLSLRWDDPRPFRERAGRPIRLLAASDEPDPTLDHAANRAALGPLDLVIGCGDLAPETLAFLGDAFRAPLVYVRGNHDRGGPWPSPRDLPAASVGVDDRSLPGTSLAAIPWPSGRETSRDSRLARRDEGRAWRQVVGWLGLRMIGAARRPWIVFSHAPPRGAGDTSGDPYHEGFAAYRFALDHLRPRLWLHGHTSRAAQRNPVVEHGPTTLVNVTGSVLVELSPPG